MRHWVRELIEMATANQNLSDEMQKGLRRMCEYIESADVYFFRREEAEKISDDLHDCDSLVDLARSLFDIATMIGFQNATLFLVKNGRKSVTWRKRVCTTLPETWLRRYKEMKYQFVDPVVLAAYSGSPAGFVRRSKGDAPVVESFWADAEKHGIGASCWRTNIQLSSGAIVGISLTDNSGRKNAEQRLFLDMSDLMVLAEQAAHTFEEIECFGAEPKDLLTEDELRFLRVVLTADDPKEAMKLPFLFGSKSSIQASIARKLGVRNLLQAVVIASGNGWLDDLPFEEDEVELALTTLHGMNLISRGGVA